MLKSLYPQIQWDNIQAVGFDMDGTLYDEFDFISEVYKPIALELSRHCNVNPEKIYNHMALRWLEQGSSYNRIFSEVLENYGIGQAETKAIEKQCLEIYRNYSPTLNIPVRVRVLLDYFKSKYPLFLITDGNHILQKAKFRALGLSEWFTAEEVIFTHCLGAGGCKPSAKSIEQIKILNRTELKKVVFFGDREVDRQFAATAGFQFVRVNCMFPMDS